MINAFFQSLVPEGLFEKAHLSRDMKGVQGSEPREYQEEEHPRRENSKCKDPEARTSFVCIPGTASRTL